jgi:ribosomal protein L21|tara:strand:+ start:484 stop:654 length:171 start_codon:yes stop_codon:yes gene_type:complete
MTKKRKLNSINPKYKLESEKDDKIILKRVLMCNASIRTATGKDTGFTAAVHGVWYK